MGRPNHAFSRGLKELLSVLDKMAAGDAIPAEFTLCETLDVSRGTVRSIVKHLVESGVLSINRTTRVLGRKPTDAELGQAQEPITSTQLLEREFLGRIQRGDLKANQRFSELNLAKDVNVSTAVVREFLIGFSR